MKITAIGEKNQDCFAAFVGTLMPWQQALGLIIDEKAVGAAVFSVDDNYFILDHIYVEEAYRRKGGGTMLLEAATDVADTLGVAGFLTYYEEDPTVDAFLTAAGFVRYPLQQQYSFPVSTLLASEKAQKYAGKNTSAGILPGTGITRTNRILLAELLQSKGYDPNVLSEGAFDPDISFFSMKDTTVNGIFLAKRIERDIVVTIILSVNKKSAIPLALLSAFLKSLDKNNLPAGCRIRFICDNKSIIRLLRQLLSTGDDLRPGKKIVSAFRR